MEADHLGPVLFDDRAIGIVKRRAIGRGHGVGRVQTELDIIRRECRPPCHLASRISGRVRVREEVQVDRLLRRVTDLLQRAPAPRVAPTKAGSAKTASVNSSQQSRPVAASDASIARMIMVVASVGTSLTVAPSTTTTAREKYSARARVSGAEIGEDFRACDRPPRSGGEGVDLMDDGGDVAVIFAGGRDRQRAVAGPGR